MKFIHFQDLPVKGPTDVEYFTIDNMHFLAFAQYRVPTDFNAVAKESPIFMWHDLRFEFFTSVPSLGAMDLEHFVIDHNHYLAVANHRASIFGSRNINSVIYRWTGSHFKEIQRIPTRGATSIHYHSIGNLSFLSIANSFDSSQKTYMTDSVIYLWSSHRFVQFQAIPTAGAQALAFFSHLGRHYLVASNSRNNSSYNQTVAVYEMRGARAIHYQNLPMYAPGYSTVFESGGSIYLTVCAAGATKGHTSIYKWTTS